MKYVFFFVILSAFAACTPKIYVIDQHTIMEQESAGNWPDFEAGIKKSTVQLGPYSNAQKDPSAKKPKESEVLNSDSLKRK